jgi:hypothetical protein
LAMVGVAALLVIAATTARGVPPASATTPLTSGTDDAPLPCTPIHQTYLGKTSFGGRRFGYAVGGSHVTYVLPPPGFHLAGASRAELAVFGFRQPRRSNPSAWKHWRAVQHFTVNSQPPDLCLAQVRGGGILGATLGPSAETSGNWVGIELTPASGAYDYVDGAWLQTGYANTCASPAYSATWVGLGGDNFVNGYQHLIQAGTVTDGGDTNYAFYEYLEENSSGVIVKGASTAILNKSLTIGAGDQIDATVEYSGSTSSYYVEDDSNGELWNPNDVSGSAYIDGSTAEFIDERPGVSGGLSNLRTWHNGNVEWNNYDGIPNGASNTNGNSADATGSRAHSINMTNGDTVASNSFSSGANHWYDTWKHCN